ncbi:MAG: AarF/ABC1/UbiB kinase family protein [Anaerolineales bacterium]|nr:AarF/ABC1/UbiB kinase family protein [Anaerolineales bacterium]
MSARPGGKPVRRRPRAAAAAGAWRERYGRAGRKAPERRSAAALGNSVHSLPRREQSGDPAYGRISLPLMEPTRYRASFWRSAGRLLTWLRVFAVYLLGNLVNRLRRRDTVERRAVRLRLALERAGGTFVKLGQQAAMRIDLLPWAYCVELSKMLDQMPPFPFEQALAAINATLGRPWQEVFAVIDPVPVGSASMACVYQAKLKDGAQVVVKVRRPGIAEAFMADLTVMDWLARLAELLTVTRPGYTRNMRQELRGILLDELNFKNEARFQDIFRRNAKRYGRPFFTAPRVFFEHSGEAVLVQEFIQGLWVWEVMAAVEQKNWEGRQLLQAMQIDPAVVARNILWASFWSMEAHVFFHADPHPANILIRANNEVVFIDFGSCGSFNNQQRMALEQMVLAMRDQDVETMARATLILMEPIPPVDLPALIKETQEEYLRVLHTFNTPAQYTQYWERTSARQWLTMIRIAQKFKLPSNLHMLRMIRATLLYDSIVLRLDNRLDRYYEYTAFMKDLAEIVKQKWRRRAKENGGDGVFVSLEEAGQALNDLLLRTQTALGRPIVTLGSTITKSIFSASVLVRLTGRVAVMTVLAMLGVQVWHAAAGEAVPVAQAFQVVIGSRLYQAVLLGAVILNARHIIARLTDPEVGR